MDLKENIINEFRIFDLDFFVELKTELDYIISQLTSMKGAEIKKINNLAIFNSVLSNSIYAPLKDTVNFLPELIDYSKEMRRKIIAKQPTENKLMQKHINSFMNRAD